MRKKKMSENHELSRREALRIGAGALAATLPIGLLGCKPPKVGFRPPSGPAYQGTDDQLLDEMQKAMFDFFWTEASPRTGQVKDRALAKGGDRRRMSSIAATGFGLSALCIADRRGYAKSAEITDRVRNTLRFIAQDLPHEHGFFYHFVDIETGKRWEKCELS